MAPITKTLALAGALFAISGVSAPVNKRAVVWETVTEVAWTTVDVTTTLFPGQAHATTTVLPVTTPVAEVQPTTTEEPAAAPTVVQKQHQEPKHTTTTTQAPAPPAPTTTQQPETTTEAPAPAPPTTTAEAPTTTAPAPAATSSSAPSSGYTGACDESSPCTGDITFYEVATSESAPSACGQTNSDDQTVVALPVGIMGSGNVGCGRTVTITHNGQSRTGTVVDKCMGCDDTSIDLSRGLFKELADFSEGRVSGVEWYIN